MTVYRVQDKQGRGPWKPGFSHQWVEDREDHENLPPWVLEFPRIIEKFRRGFVYGCGCTTLNKLRRWFTESEYQKLVKLGYRAVKMEAIVLGESDIQCVFERFKLLNQDVEEIELYKCATLATST